MCFEEALRCSLEEEREKNLLVSTHMVVIVVWFADTRWFTYWHRKKSMQLFCLRGKNMG